MRDRIRVSTLSGRFPREDKQVNIGPDVETVTLWRPTGPEELALIEASGWREWPPRLPEQPIFYPVLNQDFATMIARDWNVKHSGSGYVTRFVTRFRVRRPFLDRYEIHQVGHAPSWSTGSRPRTWPSSTPTSSA